MRLSELPLALRLVRRELRSGVRGFGVFLTCLALGVASIAAVGVFSASVRQGLAVNSKRLLGGDLEITRTHAAPGADVDALLAGKGDVSRSVRTRTMVRAEKGGDPALASLKAVDAAYPLYGEMRLASGRPLGEALAVRDGLPGAVAERALALRLDVAVGDVLLLGPVRFRLADVIEHEPDRLTQFTGLGPRLMISLDALPGTGLLGPGALVRHGLALRLAPGAPPVEELAGEARARFPDRGLRVREHHDFRGGMSWFLDTVETYLVLVGLASLLVGGIGVAGAVRSFLAGRGEAIAVMKSLGAERSLVMAVYLLQSMALALAGTLAGAALGCAVAAVAAGPLAARMGVPLGAGLPLAPVALAVAYGLLAALAFTLWPLSAAGGVRPARLFRGYAEPEARRPGWRAVAACVACVAAMFGLLAATSRDPVLPLGFGACVLGAMGALRGYTLLVKWAARRCPRVGPPHLRQAVAGLHRPGASTGAVIFSLGLGLTVLSALFLSDGNIQDRIRRRIPATAPAYFFLNVPKDKGADLEALALSVPGVTRVERTPSIRGRILEINGVPAHEAHISERAAWAVRSDRALSFAAAMPRGTNLARGRWWPGDYQGPPLICLDEDVARGFGVGPGDTLTVSVLGRRITAAIACTRDIDYAQGGINHAVIFSPGVLEPAPYTWLATAYADAGADTPLFRAVTREFPGVVAVSMREVLTGLGDIASDVALAVRACAGVTLLAGLLVLAEALRANLRTRRRDAVVFKVLGATRGDVVLTLALEFGILGVAVALPAAGLGCLGSYLFMVHAMHGDWVFLPAPLAAVILGGVAASVGLGLLGVRRALSGSAWPVLRNE
ncbi:ABC transporter permease [Desulfocurvus sp. DL9XJH121]